MNGILTRLADRARHMLVFLPDRAALALLMYFIFAIGCLLWNQARAYDEVTRSAALEEAGRRVEVLTALRDLYSSEVVARLSSSGIEAVHDYADKDDCIPLPATLTMLLGERISEKGGTTRLYSPYPFPWREDTGGLSDDFARAAWQHMAKNPTDPFYRFEEDLSGPYLRYAEAEVMRDSCVDCHNNHPDTPKRDWKSGDLRGLFEVKLPLTMTSETFLATSWPVVLLLGALSAICIWTVTSRLHKESAHLRLEILHRKKVEGERRRAEELSASVLQHASDPIAVIDASGTVMSVSESVERVFGWLPNELVGRNISILMPEPHRSCHDGYLRSYFETGKTTVIDKVRRLDGQHKDGSVLPIELTASRLATSSAPLFVGILRDLSVRIKLEEDLETARRLESIGQLAAGIAHEINTPTQYVGDNTRFLEESFEEIVPLLRKTNELVQSIHAGSASSELTEELRVALDEADIEYLCGEVPRAIQQSLGGIDRVRKIVQAMKEFSHPGAEGMTSTDLNRAIESTIMVASNEWKYVANVETDFDLQLPMVPCFPGEINQVVLNMIINAAHAIAAVVGANEEEKGTITISTRKEGASAEIRVTDTGSGIPQAIRGKIFEPFFTTKDIGKGTGQGLSHAHAIVVKKHGGTLDFETEIGKGTTFILRIPLEREAETEEAAL